MPINAEWIIVALGEMDQTATFEWHRRNEKADGWILAIHTRDGITKQFDVTETQLTSVAHGDESLRSELLKRFRELMNGSTPTG